MDFKSYKRILICKVQLFLGNEYEATEQTVTKNNGVRLTGIMAKKKGLNTYPTVYIDEYYDEDITRDDIEYIAMRLAKGLMKAELTKNVSISGFMEYESARERLFIKLINADKNKELLFDVPHIRLHNLAAVFYYLVEDEDFKGKASIMVKNSHKDMWGADDETLYKDALISSKRLNPPEIISMRELLSELYDKDVLNEEIPMYVLTNKERYLGAAAMLYPEIFKSFCDEKGCSLYVLPSSVHELILIPDFGNIDVRELLLTVTDVNMTQVGLEERLSDSVYYFDRDKNELTWLS